MKKQSSLRSRVTVFLPLFFALVLILPGLENGSYTRWMLALSFPCVLLLLLLLPSRLFFLDRPSFSAVAVLCGFGMMAGVYLSEDAALSLALSYALLLLFLLAGAVSARSFRVSLFSAVFPAVLGLFLLSGPFWTGVSFSLAEGGIALLLFSVSAFLSRRNYVPALGITLAGLLLLLLGKEIPSALLWGIAAVLLFWAGSGSGLWSLLSLVTVCALFAGGMLLFPSSEPSPSVPSLPSPASIPLLAPEVPQSSPSSGSDPLWLLLGRQYGSIFLLLSLLLMLVLLIRGASLALNARSAFHGILGLGVVLFFGGRTLLFLLSLSGLLPLASPEPPLILSSLPSLAAHGFLAGLLSGISARNEADLAEDARLSMLAR